MIGFLERAESWNLDIDQYINKIVPPSQLHKFPSTVVRFLGYREQQKQDTGNVLVAFWSCVGAFSGLATIAAVFKNTESIRTRHMPALISSFGASAVLEYNAIRSPLSQPRNAFLGQTLSAIVGVTITKLFRLRSDFEKIRWIAGATSCGVASAVMLLTGTVYPPGGASAILVATSPEITDMGWYFVVIVMWGTTLMLLVGLVINNIQRQFPIYWWTPLDIQKTRRTDNEIGGNTEADSEEKDPRHDEEDKNDPDEKKGKSGAVTISAHGIELPKDFVLEREEAELLNMIQYRLRTWQRP